MKSERPRFTLGEIAAALGAPVPDHADLLIENVRGLSEADVFSLSYVDDVRQLNDVATRTQARALLVPLAAASCNRPFIPLKNPRLGFARALRLFHPAKIYAAGIHPTADVDATATVDPSAHVGAYCRIGAQARIEAGAILHPHVQVGRASRVGLRSELRPRVHLGDDVILGADCLIHAGTVIGPATGEGGASPNISIGDSVECGARALIEGGNTVVGSGTRTDNLIRIGAGAQLGPHCLLVSCSQVGPRAVLEHHVTIAGQGMVMDSVRIGAVSIVGARGKVERDLAPSSIVSGNPAVPHKEELRRIANTMKLARLAAEMERVLALAE